MKPQKASDTESGKLNNNQEFVWFKSPYKKSKDIYTFKRKQTKELGVYYSCLPVKGREKYMCDDAYQFNKIIKEYYISHYPKSKDAYPSGFRNIQAELVIFPKEVERLQKEAPDFFANPQSSSMNDTQDGSLNSLNGDFITNPQISSVNDSQDFSFNLDAINSLNEDFIDPFMEDLNQAFNRTNQSINVEEVQSTTQSQPTKPLTVLVEDAISDEEFQLFDNHYSIPHVVKNGSNIDIDLEKISDPSLKEKFSYFLQEKEGANPMQVNKFAKKGKWNLTDGVNREIVQNVIEEFKEVVPNPEHQFPTQETSQIMFHYFDNAIKRKREEELGKVDSQETGRKLDHLMQMLAVEKTKDDLQQQLPKKMRKTGDTVRLPKKNLIGFFDQIQKGNFFKEFINSEKMDMQQLHQSFIETVSSSNSQQKTPNERVNLPQETSEKENFSPFQSEFENDPLGELAEFLKQEQEESIQEGNETKIFNPNFKN